MPVLFIGHGSPMNAIADNAYTRTLNALGASLEIPKVILVISAHWMTRGTFVTRMKMPKTIHDFGGFPQALFDVQYPAPGSPETADLIRSLVREPPISADETEWGLDHGTWSVLRHMYPRANIPVLQMSLSISDPPEYHMRLAEQLKSLREKGVLILGSGNIVHNLRQIKWDENAKPHDWALEFDEWMKVQLEKRDYKKIMAEAFASNAGRLSSPTPDHFLPIYYALGASDSSDNLKFEYEQMQNASLSMRSLSLGR